MLFVATLLAFSQNISMPAEIRGDVGAFIPVRAKTDGKVVRYVPLDPGLNVFPSSLLSDQTATVVSSARPGRYRLLAYTSIADVPSDPAIGTVVVGDPVGPIIPPDPDPVPDALSRALTGIYGGDQSPNKQRDASALAAVYRAGVSIADGAQTLGGMYDALRAKSSAALPADALRPLRERIGEETTAILSDDPAVVIDDALRARAKTLFARIATILDGIAK